MRMILRGFWLITKLRKENYNLRIDNTKLSKDNYNYSKKVVHRCDYDNLLHENMVLSSRRITDGEELERLRRELEESSVLVVKQHIKILELTK